MPRPQAVLLALLAAANERPAGCQDAANRADEAINVNNLGHKYFLGELYDAQKDEPVGGSLWPLSLLNDPRYVRETSAKSAEYTLVQSDSLKDKMKLFGIDGEVTFKRVLAKAEISVTGSAKYLYDSADSNLDVHG